MMLSKPQECMLCQTGFHNASNDIRFCPVRHTKHSHTYIHVEKIFTIFGMYVCMCGSVVQWFAARVVFVSAFSKSFPAQWSPSACTASERLGYLAYMLTYIHKFIHTNRNSHNLHEHILFMCTHMHSNTKTNIHS